MSAAATPAASPPVFRAFLPFLPVTLALVSIQLDFFSMGLALPVIAREMGTTTTDLQWVISGYMLALGALMIPAVRIADLLGRKRMLLIGVAIFGLCSLACGLATSPGMLIGFRVLQGVGGALIMPVSFSLVTNSTDKAVRARVLGLMVGLANIGTAVGPVVGGGLAATVGWRWVFWINIPVALAALIWGSLVLKESKDSDGRRLREVDWLGAILVAAAVATISLGIDDLSTSVPLAAAIGLLVAGAAILVAFVARERRARWPMVTRDLARQRPFWVVLGAGTFANACFGVLIIVVIIQLQQVHDLSAAEAGLLFTFPAVAMVACGPISGRLAGKVPSGLVMAASIVLGGVGLLVQFLAEPLALDIVGLTLSGFAFGMGFSFTSVATQSVLPAELSSQASGVVLTVMVSLGGIAVVAGAVGLELAGAATNMADAVQVVLLWLAILAIVVGVVFGFTQRHGLRRAPVAGNLPNASQS